ncbi:uncharacterized protein SETTUDRAFT_26155 [Exserohilum turcica Et28A]|uniref:Uncharacterized protein n=1 Tax=Exserohilum turcicum (strain 28A) TaxID=671987 RepID=R0KL00_EXST2|nr:uncharacterized protein SETTUDRAFT_26155 [Exserohilum turcica Et28A]EOA89829.1 hypothetical protein SETTUDRAFT_26155 [Exserohilum turcica Et28A]
MPMPMSYIDTNDLAVQTASIDISSTSWLTSSTLVNSINSLKELCLGNCRLLYGSERFRFYDIVICEDEANKRFCALLTCNMDGQTKILRVETDACAVTAVQMLVGRLQRDTAKLFAKYNVGSQIEGQQGSTDKTTGTFKLWDGPGDRRIAGPDDDTAGLRRAWSARGGAQRYNGNKRRAVEQAGRERDVLCYDEVL